MLWCAQKRKEETEKERKEKMSPYCIKISYFHNCSVPTVQMQYVLIHKTVDFKMSLKKDQKNLF